MTRDELLAAAKPIIFSGPMVLAILEGRKTQTRRVIKRKHDNTVLEMFSDKRGTRLVEIEVAEPPTKNPDGTLTHTVRAYEELAPKCRPGDILYVKEAWMPHATLNGFFDDENLYAYKADFLQRAKWRSSRYMPKKAARLFLRVTDVRAERLRDIDNGGAMAEGIYRHPYGGWTWLPPPSASISWAHSPVEAYLRLWDGIHAESEPWQKWAANPWVWVYAFERIRETEGAES
jgi:hypothetical protein